MSTHAQPFTVEINGRTVVVDPSAHDTEDKWLAIDDNHRVCRVHRLAFNTHDVNKYERRGEGASAVQISHSAGCADCYWAHWRPPKQSEIGLVSLPAWWTRSHYAARSNGPDIECLFCETHKDFFNLDECCVRCVREDDERDDD